MTPYFPSNILKGAFLVDSRGLRCAENGLHQELAGVSLQWSLKPAGHLIPTDRNKQHASGLWPLSWGKFAARPPAPVRAR